ncbi:protein bicaudal C homolog 1-B-like isoform X2 [Bolinopsis microptera]
MVQFNNSGYTDWSSRIKHTSYPNDTLFKMGSPTYLEKPNILNIFDIKPNRITMKMDISYTDHSFIIGRGGHNIQSVMNETNCHIHFPDSNRTSCKEKSNQVSLSGTEKGVEEARVRVRSMLPCTMMVEVFPPPSGPTHLDPHHPRILQVAAKYGVMISFREQPTMISFMVVVKGCPKRPQQVASALIEITEIYCNTSVPRLEYTAQLDISPQHHMFVVGKNRCNLQDIIRKTGTLIQFPDGTQVTGPRRSAVMITGAFYSVIEAKKLLMEQLPIFLMFDVKQDTAFVNDTRLLTSIMEKHSVYISIKPKPKQCCWTVVLKTKERNTPNLYLARNDLITEMENASPRNSSPWHSVCSSSRSSPTSANTADDTDELTKSLAQLLSPLAKQRPLILETDYKEKQLLAFNAVNEPDFSVSRNPTDIWSGFGLSRSVPANVWKIEKEEMQKIEERKTSGTADFPELFGDCTPCHDLPSLLTKHGLSQYLTVLQAQEVDFYTFLTLTDEDLKELGITSFGAKKKLVTAIQEEGRLHQIDHNSILNASNRW